VSVKINSVFVSNVFISFGGLLMSIKGDFKNLKNLEIDERVYLLIAAIWFAYGQSPKRKLLRFLIAN
jgi:hypothetical protein